MNLSHLTNDIAGCYKASHSNKATSNSKASIQTRFFALKPLVARLLTQKI
ncbi:hypothetical protein VCRA217O17_20462 [Vibrio crassostreae]|nr:hypothetical protein VCRA217O17_20462 [Vibrio crassostreae]